MLEQLFLHIKFKHSNIGLQIETLNPVAGGECCSVSRHPDTKVGPQRLNWEVNKVIHKMQAIRNLQIFTVM